MPDKAELGNERTINIIRDAYKKKWLQFFLTTMRLPDDWEKDALEKSAIKALEADIATLKDELMHRRNSDALAKAGLDFLFQNVELPF